MEEVEEIRKLAAELQNCQKILTAIGDENRLHLMVSMIQMNNCMGVRVGEIRECTNLSRPAVSHHLQILKDAGTVNMRKEGTKNYYYFKSDQQSMKELIQALQKAVDIASMLPERKEEW